MNPWNRQKHIIPLPYSYYFFTVAVLATIGFFDSVYLAISHYRLYTDIGHQSFCAISKAINCDTVSQSPYSILLGVPVPVWGVIGYAFFIVLSVFAWPKSAQRKRIWTLLSLISLVFTVYSIILAFVSTIFINSYCIMCIFSYAVNLLLLYFTWIVRKRFKCEFFFKALVLDLRYLFNRRRIFISAVSLFIPGILALLLFFPAYWHMTPPVLSTDIPTGVTEDGHPWIGAQVPELIIEEFSDYRCFQCKKMHYFLRQLVETHQDEIRLIHRQFPMDHTINPVVTEPFHIGSAKLSLLAIYASEKGKFWEMNDYLFNLPSEIEELDLRRLANHVNIDFKDIGYIFQNKRLWNILWEDIVDGFKTNKLSGTPGFIIDGEAYIGQIPAQILKQYLNK